MILALLGTLVAPTGAGARSSDARSKRREVQRQRSRVAADLNVLRATDAEIARALDVLNSGIRRQEVAATRARLAADLATHTAAVARAAEARQAARLEQLQGALSTIAVNAYKSAPTSRAFVGLDASSISDMARKQHFLDFATSNMNDVAEQMRVARDDLRAERERAEASERVATDRRAAVESRLRELTQARDQKRRLGDQVEARLERRLAESASLEAIDRRLAAKIAASQSAIARRLGIRTGSGGSVRLGSVSVTSVRGILVASSIAARVEALLGAAAADGLVLGGAGYRSSDAQVAMRRAHCGGDVYRKPASQCRPPTARPGRSMHERGLAIDFTYRGAVLGRSSPAYGWLRRNAARFGLHNLPSEPWHWSTNGN